ncbi:hypothetical protein HOP50_09g57110 [Chloropicon primus]|uniref:CWH43-like N-terminal domain-containing protein n=2 Tax=Chloropicon primus TaxID=1764295 RepID=A0A5B8MUL1_9CHLO|nr:hypothetical protein A3770_09p56900 [Chloropicon primus]UPR02385.1 hypothetical protein HOP50_09g57110 [Chloropicon primus]|eukprot:QDZ23172.1 hypothetical protein A3770_09p56900 [Chloropicon primus]
MTKTKGKGENAFADGMVVLGGLQVESVPIKAAILALGTIATCYITSSVLLKHTPLWLPDITHCARGSPERYFFRIGMSISCCMLIGVWVTVATWAESVCKSLKLRQCCTALPNEKASLCGAVGCLLLIMGSCCIEPGDEMPWTFHTIGASGFFICQIVAMCSVTSNVSKAVRQAEESGLVAPAGVSPAALSIKHWCIRAFWALLALEVVFRIVGVNGGTGALLEWLLTANVMVWVISLSLDFQRCKLYAAFVEPQQGLPSKATAQ